MKIASINSYVRKNFTEVAFSLSAIGLVGGYVFPTVYNDIILIRENQKREILEKDPKRYERAITQEPEEDFLHLRRSTYWGNETKKMNDSIEMNSIIQKAYFEGAQMVRDSIAGINKGEKNEHK